MTIFRLIRLPNLLIIALTQVLLGLILYKNITQDTLNSWQFALLVVTTMFIAASGYVINDIYDCEIDLINKPQKVIVGQKMTEKEAWLVYWIINFLGGFVAFYLAYAIRDFRQLLIYPSALLMLWAYAKKYKKSFVIGNLVVAAYCALVPGIIWYAERQSFFELLEQNKSAAIFVRNIFMAYALMAFLTTVWREIIKDMEDLKGDKAFGSTSIPAKYGMSLAQKMATALGVMVILLMLYYALYLLDTRTWMALGYLMLPIGLAVITVILPFKSLTINVLHQASQQIKWLMVLGIGYLFFLV